MILLSCSKVGAYCTLIIFIMYFAPSSGRRNWQHIEVGINEVVPKYLIVQENFSANLYCGGNSTTVDWTYNKYPWNISTFRPLLSKHLVGSKQVSLNTLIQDDTAYYRCSWTNADQIFAVFSIVSVMSRNYLHIYNQRYRIVSPNWVEVSKNGAVTLTCYSLAPVEWFGVHLINQNKDVREYTLSLFHLQEEHSGEYICRGFKDIDHSSIFHAKARIIVDGTVLRVNGSRPSNTLFFYSNIPHESG